MYTIHCFAHESSLWCWVHLAKTSASNYHLMEVNVPSEVLERYKRYKLNHLQLGSYVVWSKWRQQGDALPSWTYTSRTPKSGLYEFVCGVLSVNKFCKRNQRRKKVQRRHCVTQNMSITFHNFFSGYLHVRSPNPGEYFVSLELLSWWKELKKDG